MAAVKDIDADKQTLTQFDLFVDLPAELRIKIIHEFTADFRKRTPRGKLAPFAVVHSEWQHELEGEEKLFGSLSLRTDDLPALSVVLNQHRRETLFKVLIRVRIDDAATDPTWPSDDGTGNTEILARVNNFIVQSVARVLESVESLKATCSQSNKTEVKLFTQIMHHGSLRVRFPANYGLDCDFSQLLPAIAIRSFSQQVRHARHWKHRVLYLSVSSLLTLVARMPNLERASVRVLSSEPVDVTSAPQLDICPRLKTLAIRPEYGRELPGSALTTWATAWSDRIKDLTLGYTDAIPEVLHSLPTGGHSTGTVAWPNLQSLKLIGHYLPEASSVSLNIWRGGDSPSEILRAMAMALVSLPRIRDMAIIMNTEDLFCPVIMIRLNLCSRSSELSVSVIQSPPERNRTRPLSRNTVPLKLRNFWTLFGEGRMLAAAANVQEAVRTHLGLHLKVVWPEKDDKSESQ